MSDENVEPFDPFAADVQLGMFGDISASDVPLAKLAKPEIVAMLIDQQRVTVRQLQALQKETERLRTENAQLRNSREEVRVDLATLREKARYSVLQIPISVITAYAINRLSTNIRDHLGWFLLLLSSVTLIILVVQSRSGEKG